MTPKLVMAMALLPVRLGGPTRSMESRMPAAWRRPQRLRGAVKKGLPYVVVPGALEMINLGPEDTLQPHQLKRTLYHHSPGSVKMRATAEEMGALGELFVEPALVLQPGDEPRPGAADQNGLLPGDLVPEPFQHIISFEPQVCHMVSPSGVYGLDVTRDLGRFMEQLGELGYSGVISFPTVAKFSGDMRRELESVGLGFQREVDMLALARQKGFFTMSYCYSPEEARHHGQDVVFAHVVDDLVAVPQGEVAGDGGVAADAVVASSPTAASPPAATWGPGSRPPWTWRRSGPRPSFRRRWRGTKRPSGRGR